MTAPALHDPTKRSLSKELEEALMLTRSGPMLYDRSFPLDDIQISRSGDGRTVEAYAAMFDMPYEVRDQHGHYMEVIHRAAFNRTLSGGAGRNAMCLYNHGMSRARHPDGDGTVPLGTPLEIKPDGRGLLTVTRYNKGPFADQVLESIRNGDIKAQSFRGRIVRSDPMGRLPRRRPGAQLPTVTRHELGLADYGPTPIPVNSGAEIMAVRSVADLADMLAGLDADERRELLRTLDLDEATPDGDPADDEDEDEDLEELPSEDEEAGTATSERSELGAEDPSQETLRHSGRQSDITRRIRAAMITRGMR
jgi:HK97 family phage prohead protease